MRIELVLLIVMMRMLSACQPARKVEKVIEAKQVTNGEYKRVGEQLFQDKKGNLYFRTIDRSAINDEREVFASYAKQLYYDTIIAGDSTFVTRDLKGIVDPHSFKQTGIDGLSHYYKDKKHEYVHFEMADGGTLHCLK